MRAFEASIDIPAPRDAVWPILSDVVGWPGWLPTVSSVEALQGRTLHVGARYTVTQPKLRPATWMVTDLVPPQRFTWQARSPGLVMVADHLIEATSPDRSRVCLRFAFGGVLEAPLAWLFRSVTESYLAQEAAALRRRVEASR